jgi:hypothetical protein
MEEGEYLCLSDCIEVFERLPSMYHGHNFSLHLAHARKYIGVNRVGNGEFAVRFRLESYQLLSSMIYRPTNSPILPLCVFHIRQLAQLLAHLLFAPSCARQGSNALNAGTARNKFALDFEKRLRDLRLDFGPDARQSQEYAVEIASYADVEVAERAKDATALELVESDARPTNEEQCKDNVPETTVESAFVLVCH